MTAHRRRPRRRSTRPRRPTPTQWAGAVLLGSTLALLPLGCGDDTPAFCADLAAAAPLDGLRAAIEGGDLDRAGSEADAFARLADDAPAEVAEDLRALGQGVVEVVAVLRADREARAGRPDAGDPARAREEANALLGTLVGPSARVRTWATRECSLELPPAP